MNSLFSFWLVETSYIYPILEIPSSGSFVFLMNKMANAWMNIYPPKLYVILLIKSANGPHHSFEQIRINISKDSKTMNKNREH